MKAGLPTMAVCTMTSAAEREKNNAYHARDTRFIAVN
jgi:hypothetical protein